MVLSRPSRHVIFAWSPTAKMRMTFERDMLIRHDRSRLPSTTIRFGASTVIVPAAPVRFGEPPEAVPTKSATRATVRSAARPMHYRFPVRRWFIRGSPTCSAT
jgi:hypothetical protein